MSESLPPDDEPVPKLPRGKGLSLDKGMMVRIAMTVALLVMIVISARPCATMTSKFITDFGDGKGSGSAALPKPGNVDEPAEPPAVDTSRYVQLRPGMTDEEVKAAIEESKRKNAALEGRGAAAGSGSSAGSAEPPTGSAAPP